MHRLLKVDRIKHLNVVTSLYKGISHFVDDCSLWICEYIGAMHLEEI